MHKINRDLKLLSDISVAHGLILNGSKTEMLIFGSQKDIIVSSPDFRIYLNDQLLAPKSSCRNLGLWIDVDLRFTTHVSKIIHKAYCTLRSLYMHKDILSKELKLKLCNSLILSHLAYSSIVYWPAILNRDKESLQRVQNSCIRFSYNLRKFDHVSASFSDSGWLNLDERFRLQYARFIYRLNASLSPSYLIAKINRRSKTHQRNTRHCNLYSVPRHSTALFQRSFSYNAARIFNLIPLDIKALPSIGPFSRQLSNFIVAERFPHSI